MTLLNLTDISKRDLIEQRNAIEQELQRRHSTIPEKDNKRSLPEGMAEDHLFGEQYYIDKVIKEDYSDKQLLEIRKKARRCGWVNLLSYIEKEEKSSTEGVSAIGFWDMMEKLAEDIE